MSTPRSPRKLRAEAAVEAQELTIVPYLDILMNLILFMLLSMTGLALTRVVNASASGPSGAATGTVLSISIADEGFVLGEGSEETRVPRVGSAWDFEGLREAARHHRHEGGRQVVLHATPHTPFELVIATMDAVRSDADGALLFPDVTLAPP